MLFGSLGFAFEQVAVLAFSTVAAGLVTGIAVTVLKKRRTIISTTLETTEMVKEMYVLLVGEKATPMKPNPPSGLIADFNEHKKIVTQLVPAVRAIEENVKDLVADRKNNGGSSTRDAIDRMESVLGSNPDGKKAAP